MSGIKKGSDNVFKDLGFDDADELQLKAELTRQVYNILKERKLTQSAAGELLGLAQPDVSNLLRGRFTGFSSDRLIHLLRQLDRDVEIVLKRKSKKNLLGTLKVIAAT